MDIFSGPHIFVLLIIVLLIFGPSKLPKLAQSIGASMRELKKGLAGIGDELKDPPSPPPVQQASAGPIPGTQPQTHAQFTQPTATPAEPVDPGKNI